MPLACPTQPVSRSETGDTQNGACTGQCHRQAALVQNRAHKTADRVCTLPQAGQHVCALGGRLELTQHISIKSKLNLTAIFEIYFGLIAPVDSPHPLILGLQVSFVYGDVVCRERGL